MFAAEGAQVAIADIDGQAAAQSATSTAHTPANQVQRSRRLVCR
jgi:hypothetical protein